MACSWPAGEVGGLPGGARVPYIVIIIIIHVGGRGGGDLSMRPHVSSLLVLSNLSQGAIHRYYECRRRLLTIANQAEEQKRWKWCVLLRSASFTKG